MCVWGGVAEGIETLPGPPTNYIIIVVIVIIVIIVIIVLVLVLFIIITGGWPLGQS